MATQRNRSKDKNGNYYSPEARNNAVIKYRKEHGLVAYSITMKREDLDEFKSLMKSTGMTQFQIAAAMIAAYKKNPV